MPAPVSAPPAAVAVPAPGPPGPPGPPLSLLEFLDTTPAGSGPGLRERQRRALAGAGLADALGLRRVWVAEHHAPGSPSTSPLPLVAVLGDRTRTVRVGTAVSLLRVRDPYLTAEDVVTAGLFCGGRLDVGLGRGDVGGPAARDLPRRDDAATMDAAATIAAVLDGGCAWIDPPDAAPQRWWHGVSEGSAAIAVRLGLDYCHGLFLRPDAAAGRTALDRHRAGRPGGRRAVAVAVVVNTDAARARADAAAQGGVVLTHAGAAGPVALRVAQVLAETGADEVVVTELSRSTDDHLAGVTALHGHLAELLVAGGVR